MSHITKEARTFANMLDLVAKDLKRMATNLHNGMEIDQVGELELCTYAIDAQAAVYDLMKQDGLL